MFQNKDNIDLKFESRNNKLFSNETISEFKEYSMSKELSLGNSVRERLFLQRRMQQKITNNISDSSFSKIEDNLSISQELYNKCKELTVNIDNLKKIFLWFNSDELETKYVGIVSIRKLLCENEPPIEIIYDNNIIYGIIKLLNEKYSVEFKYQALWCLINITYWNKKGSGIIRKTGGIDKIISLLNNNIDEIKEMALWCLENMLPDSLKIQNYLVNKKVINILMTLLSTNNNKKIISHCVSIIKVLIKPYYKKKKDTADINKLINIISKLIMEIKYFPEDNIIKYIYQDSCFLLSYISEHFKDHKETFLENGIIQYIIELIKNPIIENDEYIFLTLLKIIGNVINGNVNQTQQILNYDILPILKKYITNNNKIIQKEICWIISNIVADTEESMIKVIDNGFFPLLLQIFENNDAETRKDVIFALCNFSLLKNKNYLEKLIVNGLLKVICDLIKSEDLFEIKISLEALITLLAFGQKYSVGKRNLIREEIEKMGLGDVLEKLQFHRCETIYEKALFILEKFFPTEQF